MPSKMRRTQRSSLEAWLQGVASLAVRAGVACALGVEGIGADAAALLCASGVELVGAVLGAALVSPGVAV